jgi:hypothetical protein
MRLSWALIGTLLLTILVAADFIWTGAFSAIWFRQWRC